MKKLIIFDCDGVLVDSEIIASAIVVEILSKFNYKITIEESIRKFTGMTIKTVCQTIFDECGMIIPEYSAEFEQLEKSKLSQNELKPLIFELIQNLSHNNIDICVASNSPKARVIDFLTLTNQLEFLKRENIFTAEQVAYGKPAPDVFLFTAGMKGYAPKDCIVIEDSATGITAALAANMRVIGFVGGRHAQYEWYKHKIQAFNIPIAHNMTELAALVKAEEVLTV